MAHNTLHFRIATLQDAPQLQQHVQAAFRAEDSRPAWTADMALGRGYLLDVQTIITQINKPETVILMATGEEDALIASVQVAKLGADLARLSMLAVDQPYQQGGIGRQVLDYAERYCRRTWGVKKMGLNALCTRKELIAWYMRRGYHKTGETSPFPRQVDSADELYFVELEKGFS